MPRKAKFSLEMLNGIKVSSLMYLKEYFSAEKVLEYYYDGRLVRWLKDRGYRKEASLIKNLDDSSPDVMVDICHILSINYGGNMKIQNPAFQKRVAEKNILLKQLTVNMSLLDAVAKVAFNDDDVKDILSNGYDDIFLCGERFHIPLEYSNICYSGVCGFKPDIVIECDTYEDLLASGIQFENANLPDRLSNTQSSSVEVYSMHVQAVDRHGGYLP